MKFSLSILSLLLISSVQASPVLLPHESVDVAKAQNSTVASTAAQNSTAAPAKKALTKRNWFPGAFGLTPKTLEWTISFGKSDDALWSVFLNAGRVAQKIAKTSPELSAWNNPENSRYESNGWTLTDHETDLTDEMALAKGEPA